MLRYRKGTSVNEWPSDDVINPTKQEKEQRDPQFITDTESAELIVKPVDRSDIKVC